MSSLFQKLTENSVRRSVLKEGRAIMQKWSKLGLLEGLKSEEEQVRMSRILENQAIALTEATSMAQGDIEGTAAVAFPLIRRVFGGLIANDLVSVQPMSSPVGLIFYLDFTYTDTKVNAGAVAGSSIYGGGVVGNQLANGVNLTSVDETNDVWNFEVGPMALNNAYTAPTSSVAATITFVAQRSGSGIWDTVASHANYLALGDALIQHDPDLSGSVIGVYTANKSSFTSLNQNDFISIHTTATGTMSPFTLVRRLTRHDPVSGSTKLLLTFATYGSGSEDATTDIGTANDMAGASKTFTYAASDAFTASSNMGAVVGTTPWGLEGTPNLLSETGTNTDIPEMDVKINSLAVTPSTRKFKSRWSVELAAALNSWHSLDAESELTAVMSEMIALEIDQEILHDLIKGATAGTYYWSRKPGKFLNVFTGKDITNNGASLPDFTGTVNQWYETLLERVNDLSATMHRKTVEGGATFIVTSPEIGSILESTAGWQADVTIGEGASGKAGVKKVATMSSKWDVYIDPYFPKQLMLVGRKGSSFLKSGYAYCPWIPLQVVPTLFDPEDGNPRKLLWTSYGKKLYRPDMYGLIVVTDIYFN